MNDDQVEIEIMAILIIIYYITRMHSSRMRTYRAWTVFPYWGRRGGAPILEKMGDPPGCRPPPVNRMTHACENITVPASLRYAVGNKIKVFIK